jgi:hypothetical protein
MSWVQEAQIIRSGMLALEADLGSQKVSMQLKVEKCAGFDQCVPLSVNVGCC